MLPFNPASHFASQAANAMQHGVVVGIPMVAATQQRSRRNSIASAPVMRQRCTNITRASLDGQTPHSERPSDEELLKTHHELMEIEQQMLLMMGHGESQSDDENNDDAMSVGSVGSSDLVDHQLHQDLSLYSSSFTNSSNKIERMGAKQTIDAHTQCYVILFGMGSEDTEGIYTLRTVEASDEGDVANVDTVVAFEDEVDAQRFATLLEASLRHQPAVYSTTWGDITEWSTENAARCRLEPSGSLLLPPESNVSVTDWERALALQRGQYTVLEEEPEVVQNFSSFYDGALSPAEEAELFRMDEVAFDHKVEHDNVSNIVDSRMANSSLNSVREELERLLGSSS
jgi:hypothetical protein